MIKHLVGILFLTLIILIVGGVGVYIAGSPIENRNVRYDQIRQRDLDMIKRAVESYYQNNFNLPASIDQLLGNNIKTGMPYLKKLPTDPKTKENYTYKISDAMDYELCATFETSSEAIAKRKTGIDESLSESSYLGEDRAHPKGYYCFTKKIPYYLNEQSNSKNQLRYQDSYPQATSSSF